ncbi:hypothetical protein HYFRA_00004589 [Hymenoscyphus fraxineus]|uniref:2EXR domain-containing protein n=1 Tax=Hymenoscyphus fraxineus TaxID=746836 RepID=A0A9N9PUM8_9HELO|nr:hypothetical protein HYFRA_00004589 [Hymenoscyphus fraxineus]
MAPTLPLSTFHLFPNLAPELRQKIWGHACPPRTITLRYIPEQDKCLSSSPPPAILQVCSEARYVASKHYRLCFGTASNEARIYFNPYLDTLYLPRHRDMGYDETLRDFRSLVKDEEGLLNELRKVAIEHVDLTIKRPWESYNKASVLRSFSKLEEVILVQVEGQNEATKLGWDEEVGFVQARGDPEKLLRIWVDFRQAFIMEEKLLEKVCQDMGREYKAFFLPALRLERKVRVERGVRRED